MSQHRDATAASDFEALDDEPSNESVNPTLASIVGERVSRRDLLRGGVAAALSASGVLPRGAAAAEPASAIPSFDFAEVAAGVDETHHVAEGYNAGVLIRWGDPIIEGAPPFDPLKQTAAAQALQFGYNNDYLGYLAMPGAADRSAHGLLVVNHEYTSSQLMLPTSGGARRRSDSEMTVEERCTIEMMAHGGSVIEVRRGSDSRWSVVAGSEYARRITAETPMEITGPVAGDERLKTSADPTGRRVLGMINNCAGGLTPWGTWLTCEENFNLYFMGKLPPNHREAAAQARYGLGRSFYEWGRYRPRFDVTKEPHEPNRFGWVVEIDPFDPRSVPKKRTALGRFKHEGAAGIISRDGRYVVYSGDDQRFDYVYRFVTAGTVDPAAPAANRDLLDAGTLSVARFNADGTMDWLPLVHGQGPLIAANGFNSQADVLIEARRAGDLVGATRMDRPEDVEANPRTGKVYVILTGNEQRKPADLDAANPRAGNRHGHIIELVPPDGDHTAASFRWEFLVKCGDPAVADVGATFNPRTTTHGWFANPDNLAFDSVGRLWIATDGNSGESTGRTDGLWAMDTEGEARATSRLFFRGPIGAEVTGPVLTPDAATMFLAVQHPGAGSGPLGRPSTFEDPSTRWPDFAPGVPPRPSVIVVTRKGGGRVAG